MWILFALFLFLSLIRAVTLNEHCDCGYLDDQQNTWTDIWHYDFQQHDKLNYKDFFLANYDIKAKYKGTFARHFSRQNVALNHGLQIAVTVPDQNITDGTRCGGIGTKRLDYMYGSFRSYMRIPHVNGTVAAMYIYNTKGEIDIEMLSAVKPPQAYFAIHPGLTEHGRASSLTHHNHILGYDPTSDFHEYRIDWLPNLAVFYIDGQEIRRMNTNVPNTIGRLMFSHWTDGNANFSKGPPKETAVLEVANVSVLFKQAVHPLCNGCRLPPEVALLH